MAMDFMPPVVVRLVADIKDFQGKIAAAEAQMGAASTSMGRGFNMMGAAAGVAGLAVAGLAAKLAIDGVQAAIEDEKAVAKLTQTMQNLGLANDVAPVEAMIDSMQRQYGIADDQLRPAMDRLLRSTKDTDEAQRALKIAMDISAGTGKDLSTVAAALGRAYDGSTTSLSRLGAGIDQATLKGKNMDQILGQLSETFQGQASRSAETYEGMIRRLSIGFDELKESLGYGFLNSLTGAQGGTENFMKALKDLEPMFKRFGEELGKATNGLVGFARLASAAAQGMGMMRAQAGPLAPLLDAAASATMGMLNPLGAVAQSANDAAAALERMLGLQDLIDVGGGDFGTEEKTGVAGGRDWAAFYGVNPSSQRALNDARTKSQELWKQYLDDMKNPSGGRGGGRTVREEMLPVGVSIVDGLIDGINISAQKLDESSARQLDRLVQGFNTAVQDSRAYLADVGKALVDSLNLSDAIDEAEKTGQNLVDVFVAQSEKVKKFGENMVKLAQAGLNETSWQQIYSQGAQNGAKIADALINGNMAQNIARVNDAVGSVTALGQKVGQAAVDQYKQTGINSALGYLEQFIEQIAPESKAVKRLMAQLDKLAAASNRTAYLNIVTTTSGGAAGGSTAIPAITAPATPVTQTIEDWFSKTYPGVPTGNFYGGIATFATGGWVSRTGPALVHQKEFVLSRDMLEGRQPVPDSVRGAVAGRSGTSITVNAQTNADPVAISREIAWNLRVGVI